MKFLPWVVGVFGLAGMLQAATVAPGGSIQEAIDQNPGQMVEVPPGDWPIAKSLVIKTDGSGLCGMGRIIQSDPKEAILTIDGAKDVTVRNVTLARAAGKMDGLNAGLEAKGADNLTVSDVSVLDNCSQKPTIHAQRCNNVRITNCRIVNYMRIGIDDRTKGQDYAFAFNAIDGTGIGVYNSVGVLLQGNSVIERNFLPTQELQQKYNLGKFVKKNAVKGVLTPQKMWDEEYNNAWTQGAAMQVSSPEVSNYVQILGNYIENAAQGLDCHCDHVVIANNIINNAFIGMKAMHGARNVIIIGNQFSRNDLWSIGLMPGAASHRAGETAHPGEDPAKMNANVDGGSIIANNIISDFGYGTAAWMWPDGIPNVKKSPIILTGGQKDFNPPLKDVLVQGNVIYDTGRDGVLVDGKPVVKPPQYVYAVFITEPADGRPATPVGLHFANNIFHPGTQGISNVPLTP